VKDWGAKAYGKCNRKYSAIFNGKAENVCLIEQTIIWVTKWYDKPYPKQDQTKVFICSSQIALAGSLEGKGDFAPR
jgi:hypothetical protein